MRNIIKSLISHAKKKSRRYYALFLPAVIILLVAGWLYYHNAFQETAPQTGSLAEDQQFPTTPQTAYRSLDLQIAGQYRFDSDTIKKVKDLGVENGVAKSVVSFKVPTDNLTEYALMTTPAAPKPSGGYPVIILCHGYATPKVYSTYYYYLSDMEEYSRDGFVVIKPDFRGQGLSLHAGSAEGAYYSMGYNTDVMSLIAAVKKTDYLDKSNINFWGHSMGAYIALRAAVLSPDIKNVILLSGPVGRINDMYKSYVAISDVNNPVAENIRRAVLLRYGTPLTNPKFWSATSPLSYLDHLKSYVQIHVGTADGIVPPRFSADLDKALSEAHKPHGYFAYKGAYHGLVNQRPQIYLRSLEILLPHP